MKSIKNAPEPSKDRSQDQSQAEVAYQKLYESIRSGLFAPGDRLRETDLAQRFSLSRTPIREAIHKLEAEGIVSHRARLGAVVNSLSYTQVIELYDMRLVLEQTAAEMAAQHASTVEIDALQDLNDLLASAGDPARAAAINQDFHACLYLAARNQFLLQATRGLNNVLILLKPTTLADEQRIKTACQDHQNIIDALRIRDAKIAGQAAAIHLLDSLRYRLKTLSK